MTRSCKIGFLLGLVGTLCCLQCRSELHTRPLVIACAANAQFAMRALIEGFSLEQDIECQLTASSSGKLTAQIMQGAPYDVFVSADMKYPHSLYQQKRTLDLPITYAHGKLVLWSLKDSFLMSLSQLTSADVKHIALANPITAPYGQAAKQVLDTLGLDVGDRLVFGESISQVNQFVVSQAVEVGFTAKSVVMSPEMQGKGKWIEIDSRLYSPILQGVVAIKNQRNRSKDAEKFISYILSESGRKILQAHGYETK